MKPRPSSEVNVTMPVAGAYEPPVKPSPVGPVGPVGPATVLSAPVGPVGQSDHRGLLGLWDQLHLLRQSVP